MNRGIDYRSDFYSLGVTFYELLCGELPFQSDDPMELVHCHIAKSPTFPYTPNPTPHTLLQIVLKLMAKNAEDRYQSALGLKYDLEKCLCQWKETQHIEPFELGNWDICDRFTIPEKLYGRETEVQTLLEAFDRVSTGASELMLVAGFSGIGKTAVVNEVHKPIVRQRGYFIKGKFDQFNRNIPLSAFVQALRDLMGQLLSESDVQLAQWQTKILAAVGENGQVLIEVIPELEQVIGKQPIPPELSGSAAQNRFNLLFQKFIEVFTTAEHPLVLFLDDLQWSDLASLQLIELLMNDNGYLLMLSAYRDNEVSPAHPFILTVEKIKKRGAIVNTITLAPLAFDDTNHLISDTLNCSTKLAQPLTKLIDCKTQGNPFFTTQFLKALHEDGYIRFDRDRCYWECDISQVNALSLTDDVVEFMALQLQKLPAETQEVLKLAACVGNQFDLATLAIVSEQSPTDAATILWKTLQEGLILPTSQVYKFFQSEENEHSDTPHTVNPSYRFLHDRVQQAAYSLIPETQKQLTHWQIGQLLLQELSGQEQTEQIFEIVNQLNFGMASIKTLAEQNKLAHLNLMASRKAKAATAYAAAVKYCEIGRRILSKDSHANNIPDSWQWSYDLTLALYEESAEVTYLNTDFVQAEKLAAEVLQQAKTLLDRVNVYITQIQSNIAQAKQLEAIQISLPVLRRLDDSIHLPEQPNQTDFEQCLQETQRHLANRPIAALLHLPEMEAPHQLAAMRILASIAPPAYTSCPTLLPIITMKMVNLSIQFGNTASSAFGYAMYGFILCGVVGDIESGFQFGQFALDLVNRFNAKEIESKVLTLVGSFINIWQQSARESLSFLRQAYQVALESGDFEFVGYSASFYCFNSLLVGKELNSLSQESLAYSAKVSQLQQEHIVHQLYLLQQTILNLLNRAEHPCRLVGEAYDETKMLRLHERDNNRLTLALLYLSKLSLCYLFQDYEQASVNAKCAEQYLDGVVATFSVVGFYFYDALVKLAQCSSADSSIETSHLLEQVRLHQVKMKHWTDSAPMNYQHKFYLIEAECNRVLGQKADAIENYDRAISGARINEYIQEEALANELAAKFYLDWGKEKMAQTYMVEAYYCYARWGAKAKTDDLEQRYPNLLQPIFQAAVQTLNPIDTLTTLAGLNGSMDRTTKTSCSSTSSINSALDFAAILKASQALSGTIQLEELLRQLTRIILQNAGGDRCALILPKSDGKWYVGAMATPEATQLCSEPLQDNPRLPVRLIQYVKNTQETVVIDELDTDLPVIDDYLHQWQPKSLLCLPIFDRAKTIGIVYLTNHATRGAFTQERILVLNFLCTQAAISLENARLYQQAQDYAQQLESSQLQLVQSEKMSALGNLVAGVAHEINNPVGFIGGNIQPARDYIQDLLGLIDLYQEENPTPSVAIEEELVAIDLDFVREDLPKLIDSMKLGVERIAHISTSLRTFSRTDKEHKVPFNLHDGIDSTILILKHRLKANENRPAIEVIKEYGNIVRVECFPGQLNQVFMNLMANSIDALEEDNAERRFEEISANPNQIKICTEAISEEIIIRISDNGVGMPESVRGRIFETGFTTKAVGKGTGLGMAIARQIIEEKHGGTISCTSEPGKGTEFAISLPIG